MGKSPFAVSSAILFMLLSLPMIFSCSPANETGIDNTITTRGDFEATAQLTEIRGEFINRDLYDYAFIMKYAVRKVHRGAIDADTIFVAHYNPQKPRSAAADDRVGDIGGNLTEFRPGDLHRMALVVPIDDYYMGGIINRYFEEYNGPIYWALWTNLATD